MYILHNGLVLKLLFYPLLSIIWLTSLCILKIHNDQCIISLLLPIITERNSQRSRPFATITSCDYLQLYHKILSASSFLDIYNIVWYCLFVRYVLS